MKPTFELSPFPLLQQPDDISCGPTSAAMVLKFWQDKGLGSLADQDCSIERMRRLSHTDWFSIDSKAIGMTHPRLLADAITRCGLESKKVKLNELPRLKEILGTENKPVICLLRSARLCWHYVVAIGYTPSTIVTADPWEGHRVEHADEVFHNAWQFMGDMEGNRITSLLDPVRLGLLEVGVPGGTAIVTG